MADYEDDGDENEEGYGSTDGTFINFAKNLATSCVLFTVVVVSMSLKSRLISANTSLFNSGLFIIIATVLISLLGAVDQYIYNNVVLGIGAALGFQLMNWNLDVPVVQ